MADNKIEFKKDLCSRLHSMLEKRVGEALEAMQALQESRASETKSSAGDKYETARAMIQIELDKYEIQLSNTRMLLHELSKIDLEKTYKQVETGALVRTNQGNYFIAVGIGKVDAGNESVYVISAASPLGQSLKGRITGDTGSFQGKPWKIDHIA